jgi:hypothetical protein
MPGGTSPRTAVSSLNLNVTNPEEERREEARERQMEEEERKGMARRKEESWALMRVAVNFLRENTDKWRERKIEECDRIREEDKRDRLAVSKEKKKRYGINRLKRRESENDNEDRRKARDSQG